MTEDANTRMRILQDTLHHYYNIVFPKKKQRSKLKKWTTLGIETMKDCKRLKAKNYCKSFVEIKDSFVSYKRTTELISVLIAWDVYNSIIYFHILSTKTMTPQLILKL
ncbi:unnamed protein product [Parnassius apollo]|uniref:(apollo) hypothetical protein n=1 Tax=Parnassius apollo TaxID=110799 RepID=A0A8S3W0F6_PARAO|nr:unnamed protein product [Parnassius apollo]